MTADGDVLYKGRNKDIVIRGGENIFPKEIAYISKYTGVTGKYMYDSTLRCCWVNDVFYIVVQNVHFSI